MTHDGRHARGTRAESDTAGLGLGLGLAEDCWAGVRPRRWFLLVASSWKLFYYFPRTFWNVCSNENRNSRKSFEMLFQWYYSHRKVYITFRWSSLSLLLLKQAMISSLSIGVLIGIRTTLCWVKDMRSFRISFWTSKIEKNWNTQPTCIQYIYFYILINIFIWFFVAT